ncbi:MAG: RecX family transcriptional regulator [Bacteroidales bacterium]|nr:RecX family transcriptional regulator [Bacteroidales bacterium]
MKNETPDMTRTSDRLRRLCSRREYCRSDVMKKALDALDGDRNAAEQVVQALVDEKYVDDLRYASAFARDKASLAGWGEVKIRYMLGTKGISKDIINMALEEIDAGKAQSRLEKLLETKYRTLKDDPQCRLKMLRFALGRGYGYDEVTDVVERLMRK